MEAFWENEPFSSLLQVMASFSPSCCLLPWSVWLSPRACHSPERKDSGIPGAWGAEFNPVEDWKGSQRLNMSLPHSLPVPLKFVFSGTRGVRRQGGQWKPGEEVMSGSWGLFLHDSGLWLQLALKNSKKHLSFHFCPPFFKLTGAWSSLSGLTNIRQEVSMATQNFLPSLGFCWNLQGHFSRPQWGFWEATHKAALGANLPPPPYMLCWKDMGRRAALVEKLVMGSMERL